MLKKKAIFLLALTFSVTSCADGWDSVKRGLTGQKEKSIEESEELNKYVNPFIVNYFLDIAKEYYGYHVMQD